MNKTEIVQHILQHTNPKPFAANAGGFAWASSNIALSKYWGKRNLELNLPHNSSLSISLKEKGTFTYIQQKSDVDQFILNGKRISLKSEFALRLKKYLDLFRPTQQSFYLVDTSTTIPIAAGLASSASGFASIIQALNNLHNWQLGKTALSILARLGSGSACRSIWPGFVEWQRGQDPNGFDSYGMPLKYNWPELRVGIITISAQAKLLSSSEAMLRTAQTSPFYTAWIKKAEADCVTIKEAIAKKDFELLGNIAENNALAMHATMMTAQQPIIYSQAETLRNVQKIWELRNAGGNRLPVFFTQDAGANLKLLFLKEHENIIATNFPTVEIIAPFAKLHQEQLILVDDNDSEIGIGEKTTTHLYAKLHRAFSVFIIRKKEKTYEILLQQRSANKYHSPNLWTNTCCGHPRPSESTETAAKRRLQEEMGFTTSLQEVGTFKYTANLGKFIEHEIDHVFIGKLAEDVTTINYNPDEVQGWQWIEITELSKNILLHPKNYTVWLPPALKTLLKSLGT